MSLFFGARGLEYGPTYGARARLRLSRRLRRALAVDPLPLRRRSRAARARDALRLRSGRAARSEHLAARIVGRRGVAAQTADRAARARLPATAARDHGLHVHRARRGA